MDWIHGLDSTLDHDNMIQSNQVYNILPFSSHLLNYPLLPLLHGLVMQR